jgi:isoleucyl-tRNA synthetase
MTKDRLYTLRTDNVARRSAQTAMYWTLEVLVRALAPILSFTAEEIWAHMPARGHDSVFFATWADIDALRRVTLSHEQEALFDDLATLRSAALKEIETLRNAGKLGGSLEAEVALYLDASAERLLEGYGEELRFYFITSNVELHAADAKPKSAQAVPLRYRQAWLEVAPTDKPKCVRCWHHRDDVGGHPEHAELCGRCVTNVDGPGEARRYF